MNAAEIEQTKLTATYLNGVAIAPMAVGAFSPVAALLGGAASLSVTAIALQAFCCFLASFAHHLGGRRVLRRLAG